jgi:hypothetical protein
MRGSGGQEKRRKRVTARWENEERGQEEQARAHTARCTPRRTCKFSPVGSTDLSESGCFSFSAAVVPPATADLEPASASASASALNDHSVSSSASDTERVGPSLRTCSDHSSGARGYRPVRADGGLVLAVGGAPPAAPSPARPAPPTLPPAAAAPIQSCSARSDARSCRAWAERGRSRAGYADSGRWRGCADTGRVCADTGRGCADIGRDSCAWL